MTRIVLVHGAWADSSSWSGVVERLQRDGHVVHSIPNQLRSLAGDSAPAPAPKTMTVTSSQPLAGTTATTPLGTTASTPGAVQPGTTPSTTPAATPSTTTGATRTATPKTTTGNSGATHTTAAHGALEGLKGLKVPKKAQLGK